MTQKWLDSYNNLNPNKVRKKLSKKIKDLKKRIKNYDDSYIAMRNTCDHKNPDGTSAISTDGIYNVCEICDMMQSNA